MTRFLTGLEGYETWRNRHYVRPVKNDPKVRVPTIFRVHEPPEPKNATLCIIMMCGCIGTYVRFLGNPS